MQSKGVEISFFGIHFWGILQALKFI